MSTATMPIFLCDAHDGCEEWTVDYYAGTASSVDGVPITETRRAPGWVRGRIDGLEYDFCPEHAAALAPEGRPCPRCGGSGSRREYDVDFVCGLCDGSGEAPEGQGGEGA